MTLYDLDLATRSTARRSLFLLGTFFISTAGAWVTHNAVVDALGAFRV